MGVGWMMTTSREHHLVADLAVVDAADGLGDRGLPLGTDSVPSE